MQFVFSPGTAAAAELVNTITTTEGGKVNVAGKSGVSAQAVTTTVGPDAPKLLDPAKVQSDEVGIKAKEIAEAIIRDRESREVKAKEDAENSGWKTRASDAEAKLKEHNSRKENIILDAAGYLEEAGLDKDQIAMVAEMLMFHLVPDKAPADLRARAVEAQYKRDKVLAEKRSEKEKAEAEAKTQKAQYEEAQGAVRQYAKSFADWTPTLTENEYKHSVKWFGQNHDEYAAALFNKANQLSSEATKRGKMADLSREGVAKALEDDYSERAKHFGALTAPPVKETVVQTPPPKQPITPPTKLTVTDERMNQRLMSDKERIDRAVAAAFGQR